MLKNYIIISLRYLQKNVLFVGINIIGLAVALALCITAYLNNKYDADWDKIHSNYQNIYKINITREIQDRQQEYGITPFVLGSLVGQDITGLNEVCRYARSYSPVKYNENIFNKRIGFVDSNFGDVFDIQILLGDANALKDKGNVLISKEIAEIYFGQDDPLGKVISIMNDQNKEFTFIVAGVYKNLPLNSSLQHEILTQISNYRDMWEVDDQNWDSWVAATFVLIRNQQNIPSINQQLQKYIPIQNAAREDWQITSFFVKSLEEVADDMDVWANWLISSFHPAAVAAPPIMAIFILIIAAFNFMNSSISFAGKRLKEIGLRKVFGGLRRHIVIQFLSENLIISFIAIVIGIFLSGFLVPGYSSMWEYMDIRLRFSENPSLIGFIILLWIITALLAGAYPAFYISRFNPVKIFKERLKLSGKNRLSKVLLAIQFAVSVMALVAGVMFTQNAVYQQNLDLGYDKDEILVVTTPDKKDYKPFEQVIKGNPKVEMYAGTNYHIGYGNYNRSIKFLDQKIETNMMLIGYDYLKTMGVDITNGREFNIDNMAGDIADNNVIVNQKFVNDFGLKDPVGKTIYENDTLTYHIIGVANNVFLYGVWEEVMPLIYRLSPEEDYRTFAIKAKQENLPEINESLKSAWAELIPNYPYEGRFQEQLLDEAKQINQNIKTMFIFLAVCALFLSAIGLYTLVSLSVLNRTKEVGIRKVMGASVEKIMIIITKPFIIIIAIAAILGSLGGYYISVMLMDSIWDTYSEANIYSFLIPVSMVFVISMATVIWRVYKSAMQNPTQSLRYE
ncbi:MAG: FtsX-like permease family protein [Bacteroidales bacterium]